jgi:hypothetical protein
METKSMLCQGSFCAWTGFEASGVFRDRSTGGFEHGFADVVATFSPSVLLVASRSGIVEVRDCVV